MAAMQMQCQPQQPRSQPFSEPQRVKTLEQGFVMTGLQGEIFVPNFSGTRSNPDTAKSMRTATIRERLLFCLLLSPRKRAVTVSEMMISCCISKHGI